MNNIKKLENAVTAGEFDALLLTSDENRFYATGYASTDGVLFVSPEGSTLFIDARYSEEAAARIQGAKVVCVKNYADVYGEINALTRKMGIKDIGVEADRLSHQRYTLIDEKLDASLRNAGGLISKLRAVKEPEEIELMLRAQRIAEQAFRETVSAISTDMTEKELAAELFCRMIKNGAEDRSFDSIVVSGTHSSMPHGKAEDRKLQRGFLTVDFGCRFGGYCSDTTRTLCIGEPTAEMRRVYDTVKCAQTAALDAARAGISGRELDAAARDVIADAGYGEYFSHSLSHGLGIEIHEAPTASPRSEDVLPAGAVISVEPGIYIPECFGVRIEDVICLSEGGAVNFTQLNKDLTVICA